jgi:hypothetical protein
VFDIGSEHNPIFVEFPDFPFLFLFLVELLLVVDTFG